MRSQEYVFKVKDIMDPNDILSLWIIKLSMARNDFMYVHKRFNDIFESNSREPCGESVYLFRLAVSHYREIVKFIDKNKDEKDIK